MSHKPREEDLESGPSIKRRHLLQGISTMAAASIAGCSGEENTDGEGSSGGESGSGSGGGGSNLGERVPAVEWGFWTDMGARTQVSESTLPIFKDNIESAIGVDVELVPGTLAGLGEQSSRDLREVNMELIAFGAGPDRLDPHELLFRWLINGAGDAPVGNRSQYHSCEYSLKVVDQMFEANPERRQEHVDEALSIMAEDIPVVPITTWTALGAVRTDQLNPTVDAGRAGILAGMPEFITGLESAGADRVMLNGASEAATNILANVTETSTSVIGLWNHLPYSPLVEYDRNLEIRNLLADDIAVSDDGLTYEVTLKEAEFHDGSQITSEDAAWTHQYLTDNIGTYRKVATSIPYESFDIIDDTQFTVNLSEPAPALLTRAWPKVGILPKDVWVEAGAEENPGSFELETPLVGSGPYQLTQFERDQLLRLEPFDNHPVYSPSLPVIVTVYDTVTTMARDFEAGNLNAFKSMPFSKAPVYGDDPDVEVVTTHGWTPFLGSMNMAFGPFMFREFRHAISQAVDRDAFIEAGMYGLTEPETAATTWPSSHPWHNPEILQDAADSTTANPERAKEILEEAGWGWDDNGNLHYPEGADLTPAWPQGDTPSDYPDKFPCVVEIAERLDFEPPLAPDQ